MLKNKDFISLSESRIDMYAILQAPTTKPFKFIGHSFLIEMDMKVSICDYDFLYSGKCNEIGQFESETELLDKIYSKFNLDIPSDFRGHSLSVSDVILFNKGGVLTAYYVDTTGFVKVPNFISTDADR